MSNLGYLDRAVRIIAGVLLIALPLGTGWPVWSSALAYWSSIGVGTVLAATAVVGFCPLYALAGVSGRGRSTHGDAR